MNYDNNQWLRIPRYMFTIEERKKIIADWEVVKNNARDWSQEEEKALQDLKETLPR